MGNSNFINRMNTEHTIRGEKSWMKRHGKRCQLLEVVLFFFLMRVFFFFLGLHVGLRARTAMKEYQGDQAGHGKELGSGQSYG